MKFRVGGKNLEFVENKFFFSQHLERDSLGTIGDAWIGLYFQIGIELQFKQHSVLLDT